MTTTTNLVPFASIFADPPHGGKRPWVRGCTTTSTENYIICVQVEHFLTRQRKEKKRKEKKRKEKKRKEKKRKEKKRKEKKRKEKKRNYRLTGGKQQQ